MKAKLVSLKSVSFLVSVIFVVYLSLCILVLNLSFNFLSLFLVY